MKSFVRCSSDFVILTACLIGILLAWGSAWLMLRHEHRKVTSAVAIQITAKQEAAAALAREQFLLAENRVRVIAQASSVAGIGRALANGGLDPLEGNSLELWRARLDQICRAYVANTPEICQLRLIGVADGGRELYCLAQDAHGRVTVVAPADLQQDGNRSYFTETVRLPDGGLYLSPIELNREQGRIEQPPRPVLHAAVPVRNAQGAVFGVVAVTILAQRLFDGVATSQAPDVSQWVTDAAGHFLWHPQRGKAFTHELAPPGTPWPQEFALAPAEEALAPVPQLPAGTVQATMRGRDGAAWLMFTHTLRAADGNGAGGVVLHSGVRLDSLDDWSRRGAAGEILLVWVAEFLILGWLVVGILQQLSTLKQLSTLTSKAGSGKLGGMLEVSDPKLLLPDTGRPPLWQVVAAALLPFAWWGLITAALGQPSKHAFILMLLPVMLASWWGGLYAGLAATILAVVGAWDLTTVPILDWTAPREPQTILSALTLLVTGLLVTFLQEAIRRRGALLVSTMRTAQQRESQATLILNQASDLIQSVAPDGRILFCNAAWEETLGYTAADRKNLNIFDIVAPDCAEHCGLTFRRLMSGEDVGLVTVVFLAKNGKRVELEGHVSVAFEEGRPTRTLGVFRDVTEQNAQHRRIEKQNNLQNDLHLVQADFINKSSASDAFERLLAVLLKFTQSEYGFIGEVLSQTNGQPYLKTHALTNIAWNEETRRLYDEQAAKGMEFHNLKTLFGAVMVDGRPVIANDPGTDPRRGGLPPGHPPMNAFLGLPIKHGDDLIGMIGVANRPGGYSEEMIGELAPLLSLYASLIVARKSKQEQEKTLMALQQSEAKFRDLWELSQEAHVLCFPPDWKLTGGNQAAVRLFGARDSDHLATITPAELSPELQPDGEPSSAKLARLIEQALREGTSSFEWAHRRPDGTEWPAEVKLGRFSLNGRIGVQATVRNISEKKTIEQLTRENAERYQAMADSASSAIISVDAQGKIMAWNKGAEKVFGYTAAEIMGEQMSIIIPERYREAHAAGMQRVARGGPSRVIGQTVELQALRKNGTEFEMELSLSSWTQGGRVFFSGIIQDITTRKSAERRLADFKAAMDQHAIVAITDNRGRITYVNERFCQISKYSQKELLGQDHRIINSGYHGKEFFAHLWKTILSGQVWHGEIKNRAKDGSYYWVETSIVPFFGEDGKPAQFIAIRNDITPLKVAEEKILAFSKNLEELVTQRTREMQMALTTLDASTDGAFIFDPKTLRFSYVNRGAENLTGYSREELLAMTFLDLGTEFTEPKLREHLATGEAAQMSGCQISTVIRRKDGQFFSAEISLKYVAPSGEQPRYIAMARDISERIKQERFIQRKQRMESLGTLASGIAHDLNNALAPILMGHELLRSTGQDTDVLDTIQLSGRRAAAMVQQLLTFAKGQQEGRRSPVKISDLVAEIRGIIESTFPKNIILHVELQKRLPKVLGDSTQLHQVLLNLCVNARDAMPRGGQIKIKAYTKELDEVYIASQNEVKPGHYLLLEVGDTGTGIPPSVLDHIFEPFFTTKNPDKGTGLGLSTVLGIVKSHGGCVQVYTEQDKGTKFTVYLPVDKSGFEESSSSSIPRVDIVGTGQIILLVDDEAPIRQIGAAILSRMGFKAITASDGMEGLLLATEHRSKLGAVITDVEMPHMNGTSLIKMLRRMSDDFPIAAMSGRFSETTLEELAEFGVTAKLSKPFTESDLKQVLQELLTPRHTK